MVMNTYNGRIFQVGREVGNGLYTSIWIELDDAPRSRVWFENILKTSVVTGKHVKITMEVT